MGRVSVRVSTGARYRQRRGPNDLCRLRVGWECKPICLGGETLSPVVDPRTTPAYLQFLGRPVVVVSSSHGNRGPVNLGHTGSVVRNPYTVDNIL